MQPLLPEKESRNGTGATSLAQDKSADESSDALIFHQFNHFDSCHPAICRPLTRREDKFHAQRCAAKWPTRRLLS